MRERISLGIMLTTFLAGCLVVSPDTLSKSEEPLDCRVERVIDGDTLRCVGMTESVRLHAIDAPELGACHGRAGRVCVDGDGPAAKAFLAGLIGKQALSCHKLDTDRYGRSVMACKASDVDLSCAMVASGHAVERYGKLDC